MPISTIEHNPLLFGHDERPGIVAVESVGHFIRLFFRNAGRVYFHDEPFQPFILVADAALVSGCHVPCAVRRLIGDNFFRCQLLFDSWNDCLSARDFLAAKTGKIFSAPDAPYLFLPDLSHQYMLASGTTLFKGLEFSELRCLALDIETACAVGYGFSNPDRPEDRIISIALKDSHGEEVVLRGDQLSEPELLQALNGAIQRCDPDVITGHNIFRFDLDYIGRRAQRHGIRLTWGRNGSPPHITPHARWSLAEKTLEYPRWDVYGRHIVDTYFLVQLYDVAGRNLESHGLKAVARHFGIAATERTYLDGADISAAFENDPEQLYRYNLDDVRETLSLFRLLGYPWFLQSRIFPYSFQNCIIRGNATRINSLFLREYLHSGHAIPARTTTAAGATFEGGYTESSVQGVVGPIVHCDVASLYPSLMLTYRLVPSRDALGLFLPMLAELRRFRLTAKQLARDSALDSERNYYDALQQVFKVLINSFYGYLGAAIHNFSDPAVAAEVTRLGRVTIRNMIDLLVAEGARPVEVDTDGIYFKPPNGCVSEEAELALVGRVSAALPEGIDVELDGRYRSMFAYKAKNYALQDYAGRIIIKGSGLRSRGLEPYLREFMREVIACLLAGKGGAVAQLFDSYAARLRSRTLDVAWVARSESLNESPDSYKEKVRSGKRNRSAAFEIAIASDRPFRAGDRVSYYISGSGREATAYEQGRSVSAFDPTRPDINVLYYVQKLRHVQKRFEPFLPKEPTLFDV
ncbi:MAG: DNA polymerase domain-containing protein [Desulfuromonadaceae bacterium]|nr:DNA polymerase domain-containing protein [Desulfuromonadaceae bacterium]MDD2849432.1 DNA polymerase domain-containing protein [Desulfuromonadaceae bacterium]MDD4130000.1 DNA polymerase domain-containing protein [Desulfuromonadaceae bacterium]